MIEAITIWRPIGNSADGSTRHGDARTHFGRWQDAVILVRTAAGTEHTTSHIAYIPTNSAAAATAPIARAGSLASRGAFRGEAPDTARKVLAVNFSRSLSGGRGLIKMMIE